MVGYVTLYQITSSGQSKSQGQAESQWWEVYTYCVHSTMKPFQDGEGKICEQRILSAMWNKLGNILHYFEYFT